MTTTSLKLPDRLKQRTAMAAQKLGITTHAFMVNAIEQAALSAEARSRFVAEAQIAYKSVIKSGKGYDADEVHAYLKKRAAGVKTSRPRAKSWRA